MLPVSSALFFFATLTIFGFQPLALFAFGFVSNAARFRLSSLDAFGGLSLNLFLGALDGRFLAGLRFGHLTLFAKALPFGSFGLLAILALAPLAIFLLLAQPGQFCLIFFVLALTLECRAQRIQRPGAQFLNLA